MFSQLVSPLLVLILLTFGGYCNADEHAYSFRFQQHVRWNYWYTNTECTGSRDLCTSIHMCNFTTGALALRGRPTLCSWKRDAVPKVCCGLPLVHGETRMQAVQEEKSQNTPCGRSMVRSARSLSNYFLNSVLNGLIIGGVNATQGEFPWMVAINIRERQSTYVPHCTGFLIDDIHVLTAAHCFNDSRDPIMFIAKIGDVLQSASTTYSIRRIVVHRGYMEGRFYNDIAVMTLSRTVQEQNFNPVCLPTQDIMRMNLTGRGMTVAGWGSERFKGALTDHLKKLEFMPIVSNQQCNRRLSRMFATSFREKFPAGINSNFLCAGFREGMQDSCGGDSGGPLMLQLEDTYYVVGLVSFGVNCGRPGTPGGYTQISSFMDWIRSNTRD